MDLLKFMRDKKPTTKDIEKWDNLSAEQAYKVVYDNMSKGLDEISRFTGRCSKLISEKEIDELIKGLCNDLSKIGFSVDKVLKYIS